jgi:hypothetical protein
VNILEPKKPGVCRRWAGSVTVPRRVTDAATPWELKQLRALDAADRAAANDNTASAKVAA